MNVYFRFILLSCALVVLGACKDDEAPVVSLAASSSFFNAEGTLTLTADATDNKRVKKVVFMQGDEVVATDKKAPFALDVTVNAGLNGYHLYTATAYDSAGNHLTSAPARVFVSIDNKFFGTAPGDAGDYEHLLTYFNQLTPENAGKWVSVEATRDVMNWTDLDIAYHFARDNGIPFKFHTLIWGQQQPAWIDALPPEEQLEEINEWMTEVAARYTDLEMIEVVNEPLHAPPAYAAALGGAGETGWDWVIKSFELAREYFPNSQLILNDYQILHLPEFTADYLEIITLLQERGLIDAIGEQAHFLEQTQGSMVQTNLDSLAATGLPLYLTEFDLHLANDAQHANKMRELFTVFWEHPSVVGVTHWGHREGSVWRTNAYLLRADDSERPAMQWLVCYLAGGGDSCTVPEYVSPGWQGDEFGVTLEAELYDQGEGLVALGDVVAFTDQGDWISFSRVKFQTAWNKLWINYAKGNTDVGSISIHLDSLENAPVATVTLEPTPGWGSFQTIEVPWTQLSGTRDVYIRFNDVNGVANIDDIRFGRPIPTSNENLVVDGGFERSTIAGWSGFGNTSVFTLTTDPVFSGNQSMQVTNRSGVGGFAAYNLTAAVRAGTSYPVSAQVYHTGAGPDTVRLVAKVGCASGNSFNWLQNNTAVAPGVWTQLSGDMVIPAACVITDVQIYFEGTNPAATVYIDEVKVVPPAVPSDGNLVTDSGFEGPVVPAGWQTWFAGGTVLQLSNAKAFAGSKSLRASNRVANSNPSFVLTTLVQPGTTYGFSAQALHTGAAADTFIMTTKLACSGQSDQFLRLRELTGVAPDTWTQLSGTLQIPAGCTVTEARVYFEGTTPGVDVYLDEVKIFPNRLPNGGFEAGIAGWSSWIGATLSASTAQVFAGAQSLLATNRSSNGQFAVSPNIGSVLTAGTSYAVSARVYQAGAAADLVRMVAKVRCGTSESFNWLHSHTSVPANTWTQLSQNALAIPAGCDRNEVLIFFEGTTPGVDVYIDEVTVLPL